MRSATPFALGQLGETEFRRTQHKLMQLVSVDHLLRGLLSWINGDNLRSIELILGGEPDHHTPTKYVCPRAREIAGTIVPRAISFILSLVARVASDAIGSEESADLDRQLIEFLGTIVRRGFSSPEMMFYAMDNKHLLGRVQVHAAWKTRFDGIFDDLERPPCAPERIPLRHHESVVMDSCN